MKDMATHTRVNPRERMERLTNFANRLLNTPDVSYFSFYVATNCFHSNLIFCQELFKFI